MAGGRRRHRHADLDDDNVVASGQSFDLSGSGAALSFLLTAGYGPASGIGQVVYSDGTTQSFTLSSPGWRGAVHAVPKPGQRPELAAGLRLQRLGGIAGGQGGNPGRVAGYQLRVASGSPSLHIFAVTIQ
jgi:hypothetical protein